MKKIMMTLIALAIAVPAMANPTVSVDFQKVISGISCKSVHFQSTGATPAYSRDYAGTAGIYDILVNGTHERVFCIDLRQNATTNTVPYEIVALQDAPRPYDDNDGNDIYPMNNKKANDIRELWAENIASVSNGVTAAAFQLAIWEIVHEEKGAAYDLSSGNGFWATNDYAPGASQTNFDNALNMAQGWLNSLDGNIDADPINLRAYVSDNYQCYVGEGTVPAPGALLLSSLGTMFVGWIRQRKNMK